MTEMGQPREYYPFRYGAVHSPVGFADILRMLAALFIRLEYAGWFSFILGKDCVDDPKDIGAIFLDHLGFDPWPFRLTIGNPRREVQDIELSEEQIFGMIEFLYDHVAKPIKTKYHPWNDCGVHVMEADRAAGKAEFSERINHILSRYGYELRDNGEIWKSAPAGMEQFFPEQAGDPSIDNKVSHATATFRRFGASDEDKRDAIRNLAGVLEYRRSEGGTGLPSEDEARLFEIANQFGFRHHNQQQRTDYDSGMWLEWIFYSFLNAIDLMNKLANRRARQQPEQAVPDEIEEPPF